MYIHLINPPTLINPRTMTSHRPSLPIGLAYIAAALRKAGHRVSILDAIGSAPTNLTRYGELQILGLSNQQIVDLVDPGADIVGISNMFTFNWPTTRDLIKHLKQAVPHRITIAGGENVSGMAEYCLKTAPLDFVVSGEGEVTIVELLEAIEHGRRDFRHIPGLVYRTGGDLIETPPRRRIREVDSIPWPAWDLFDVHAYYRHRLIWGVDAGMTIPIFATRGCPYGCRFCSASGMWHREWYARSPRDVADEIEHYMQIYGATNFPFADLTTIVRKDWIISFCREIIQRSLSITWQLPAGTRCEVVDEEVAHLLKISGIRNVAFAVESGSSRLRKSIDKRISEDVLLRSVRASVRQRVPLSVFFIIGLPTDSWRDVFESVKLAVRLAIAGVNDLGTGYFYPVPGAPLFDELLAKGKVQLDDVFFQTSLHGADFLLKERFNYSGAMSARSLSASRFLLLLSFYTVSYLVRPWRICRVAWNVLRGKETTKLEVFLNGLRNRLFRFSLSRKQQRQD